jgi:hypothetical protein
MKKSKKALSVGSSKELFPSSCHVCLIYENEEQRKKIVARYLAEGLIKGELVRYFADNTKAETVQSWLSELKIDISEAGKIGAFALVSAESAYCPDNQFDPHKTIASAILRYRKAQQDGYKGSCVTGEMSWVLKNIPGSDRFIEYEVLLNTVDDPFPHKGMCQYDARLFDGVTLLKILQVHPYIMAQGQIVQNPYYIRPEDFVMS